ncbi:hypothetical protein EDD21DRAFT_445963 [Dissophora ornata]|nr:hypothetical protein EDD21DRAFT_445963 [Dissophora ornata]
MAFHFYSNIVPADHGVLSDACVCSERNESGTQPQWDTLTNNHNAVRLSINPPPSPPHSNDIPVSDPIAECNIRALIHAFAPNNPTILFATPSTAINKLGAISRGRLNDEYFQLEGLTILSSSRTAEVYSQGEYVGTFRGEPMLTTMGANTNTNMNSNSIDTASNSSSSSSSVPLFKIQVGQEALPQKSRALLVKFFIPKKTSRNPTNTPDALTLHWMVVHGSSLSSISSSSSSVVETTATNPTAPTPQQQQQLPMMPFSAFMPAMAMAATSGAGAGVAAGAGVLPSGSAIDLEKVREMLSQVQLDNLPQGAKDLMKVMQMQAMMSRSTAPNSVITATTTLGVQPIFLPQPVSAATATTTTTAATATAAVEPKVSVSVSEPGSMATGSSSTFVTRTELVQMETRIMDMIDRRFQEMEGRIVDRILSSSKNER